MQTDYENMTPAELEEQLEAMRKPTPEEMYEKALREIELVWNDACTEEGNPVQDAAKELLLHTVSFVREKLGDRFLPFIRQIEEVAEHLYDEPDYDVVYDKNFAGTLIYRQG